MEQTIEKKLSLIVEQTLTLYLEEVNSLGIEVSTNLKCDFLFNDPKPIAKWIEGSLFNSICNIKFIDDKWITINGHFDCCTKTYQLVISDSKAAINDHQKVSFLNRLTLLVSRNKNHDDKKFYNYQKSHYYFSLNDGSIINPKETETCPKQY